MIDVHSLRDGDVIRRLIGEDEGRTFYVKRDGNSILAFRSMDAVDFEYSVVFNDNWELVRRAIRIPEDLKPGDIVRRKEGNRELYEVDRKTGGTTLVARLKNGGGLVMNFNCPENWEFVDRPLHAPTVKPPLGLKPRKIHDEERLQALAEAITRYVVERKPVPEEWFAEYDELIAKKDKGEA